MVLSTLEALRVLHTLSLRVGPRDDWFRRWLMLNHWDLPMNVAKKFSFHLGDSPKIKIMRTNLVVPGHFNKMLWSMKVVFLPWLLSSLGHIQGTKWEAAPLGRDVIKPSITHSVPRREILERERVKAKAPKSFLTSLTPLVPYSCYLFTAWWLSLYYNWILL